MTGGVVVADEGGGLTGGMTKNGQMDVKYTTSLVACAVDVAEEADVDDVDESWDELFGMPINKKPNRFNSCGKSTSSNSGSA